MEIVRNKVLYAPKNEMYCVSVLMGAHEGMYWRIADNGGVFATVLYIFKGKNRKYTLHYGIAEGGY